jgi:Spy/CpxP family protein refolding chaperone
VNSWKIILAALVIFGAGVMAGSLVATHHPLQSSDGQNPLRDEREHPSHMELPRPPLLEQSLNKKFLQRLNDKLQLTPEQKEKIQKIISDGQEKNHSIWTNVAPQFRGVIMETHRQIREQLTPGQQKEFEELLKQLHPPRRQNNSTNAPPNDVPKTNSPAAALAMPCA